MLRYSPFRAAFVQSLSETYQAIAGNDLREHESFGLVYLPIRTQKPRKVVSILPAFSPNLDRAILASLLTSTYFPYEIAVRTTFTFTYLTVSCISVKKLDIFHKYLSRGSQRIICHHVSLVKSTKEWIHENRGKRSYLVTIDAHDETTFPASPVIIE